ncbi:MAG: hypothetical protein EOM50_17570 [Erysipelotrichia bacterium]|nr:hypothetical protein [Erysipelotrichia bacterium]
MSGGMFEYDQYRINDMIDKIEKEMQNPSDYVEDKELFILTCKEAIKSLKIAFVFAHRIDWFLSGDDGEDSFYKRLREDLEKENT